MSLIKPGLAGLAAALLMPAAALADPPQRSIPSGHLPPPGECRAWLPGVPPGQQPPPTDCRTARREARHHGGRLVYGGREGRDEYSRGRDRRYHERDGRRGDRCDEKDWRKGEC